MTIALSYASTGAKAPLTPWKFERRAVGAHDVGIQILWCGICHSDIHTARSEWNGTQYPVVPGHEIVGKVTGVGASVTKFKTGDLVGVGCMVDSCQTCGSCAEGLEQFCEKGFTGTYNAKDKVSGGVTYGGYSDHIVVSDKFVLTIPKGMDPAGAAPLLCAGITTYSPLKHWGTGPGKKVGVVGLGGLGHMALKIAHAMGAKVVLFTTSASKTEDAKRLGADSVVLSKDDEQMKVHAGSFDLIVNSVSASHDLGRFLVLLKREGTMCMLGVPEKPHTNTPVAPLIFGRRSLSGSLIGGIAETQEMLDFCAKHNLVSDIEVIPAQQINEAYDRTVASDVKYRFVIDMSTLK